MKIRFRKDLDRYISVTKSVLNGSTLEDAGKAIGVGESRTWHICRDFLTEAENREESRHTHQLKKVKKYRLSWFRLESEYWTRVLDRVKDDYICRDDFRYKPKPPLKYTCYLESLEGIKNTFINCRGVSSEELPDVYLISIAVITLTLSGVIAGAILFFMR